MKSLTTEAYSRLTVSARGPDLPLQAVKDNLWTWLICFVLTLILATRSISQAWSVFRAADTKFGTLSIHRLPYWLPYFGTTPFFRFRSQSWLLNQSRTYQSGVFAIYLSGQDHIVVTSPALQARLFDPATPVSTRPYDDARSRRLFSNSQTTDGKSSRVSQALQAYFDDNARLTKVTGLLEAHAYNFVSGSKSWVDQAQWERSADVQVLSESPMLSISASLPTLVRDFSSYIMLSTLVGTSFVEANPGFVNDFLTFSGKFATFMTGLPYWLAPGLGPPALARERCLLTLDGLITAIIADIDGRSMQGTGAGMLYDLEDVHPVVWDLIRKARSDDIKTRTTSCEVLEIVWQTTFSAVNVVIWLLIYLFMDGDSNRIALQSIRVELKSILEVIQPKPTGLPFEDPPRLKFSTDVSGDLVKNCPVLTGALLEVQRLKTELEEYLTIAEDFVLQSDSKSATERFEMRKGDRVYAAYGATNKDSRYWDRPRRFAPNRFMSKGAGTVEGVLVENGLPKMRSAQHQILQADVLCVVAALLAFFDISSLNGDGLKHPGAKIVAGVGVPADVNAKVTRRQAG